MTDPTFTVTRMNPWRWLWFAAALAVSVALWALIIYLGALIIT